MPILVVVVDRIINKSPVSAPKIASGIGAYIGVIPDLMLGLKTMGKVSLK